MALIAVLPRLEVTWLIRDHERRDCGCENAFTCCQSSPSSTALMVEDQKKKSQRAHTYSTIKSRSDKQTVEVSIETHLEEDKSAWRTLRMLGLQQVIRVHQGGKGTNYGSATVSLEGTTNHRQRSPGTRRSGPEISPPRKPRTVSTNKISNDENNRRSCLSAALTHCNPPSNVLPLYSFGALCAVLPWSIAKLNTYLIFLKEDHINFVEHKRVSYRMDLLTSKHGRDAVEKKKEQRTHV